MKTHDASSEERVGLGEHVVNGLENATDWFIDTRTGRVVGTLALGAGLAGALYGVFRGEPVGENVAAWVEAAQAWLFNSDPSEAANSLGAVATSPVVLPPSA